MKIAVLGTGEVGRTLGRKLVSLGHEVTLGSRTADNPAATGWAAETGGACGTFADAAAAGEVIVNATGGLVSVAALTAAGAANLAGKVLIDVSNPLDFSGGFPPKLVVPPAGSCAEEIQQAFPEARVVKALQSMNNAVMVDPARVPGHHNVFICGDDPSAREVTADLLRTFGWRDDQILDLGPLSAARGTEPLVLLWISVSNTVGTADFNFAIAH
ncbi:NADPH-dependent F420 reductase [Actinomadura rupiterrae]|uniref:NADPH-dependent F420 reductase n=1 Tax=Actinomadura rupiterrae TaxID=559627 RepID=UPI0020A5E73F|nr:NAD(P)-binding domain-containing protein [Actinomadura rupiterrae]MCP2342576.1 hypothetical protein [Actinomadura rupiterrae]